MPPTTLESNTHSRLQPAMFPEDARRLPVAFGANQVIPAGTVLAKDGNGKHWPYTDAGDYATAVGLCEFDIATDASGNVYYGNTATPSASNPPMGKTAPMFIAGTFAAADIVGEDANALTDLGTKTLSNGLIRIP